MSLLSVQFFGQALAQQASISVILPPGNGPFPVLYLLHGLSDDHTIWLRRTSVERYVEGRGLIVVMPAAGRSFYCNDPRPTGQAYEDHIVKDVVGFVDQTFRTIASRRGRALAGLSMGGYGSVMLALRHPEMFSVACSHSGALAFCQRKYDIEGIDPADIVGRDRYNCFKLAASLKRKGRQLPAMRIDCGAEDFLLEDNRTFHAHLDKLGVKHVYEEYPGSHTWEYWDEHIRQSLDFILPRVVARASRKS